MVKNPPAMQEMPEIQVRSLGWEDPLKVEMATHSSTCVENPMGRGAWQATVHRVTKSQMRLNTHALSSVQSLSRVRLFATP